MSKEQTLKSMTEAITGACYEPAPMSIVDQLVAKRAKLAADHKRKIQKLDRQINMLEQSDAERLVREAQETLYAD